MKAFPIFSRTCNNLRVNASRIEYLLSLQRETMVRLRQRRPPPPTKKKKTAFSRLWPSPRRPCRPAGDCLAEGEYY